MKLFSMITFTIVFMIAAINAEARDLTRAEKERIKSQVSIGLKDPESARYKWPRVDIPSFGFELIPYCGWVNSRNGFGAYVGFEPFWVWMTTEDGKILATEIMWRPGVNREATAKLSDYCYEDGYGLPTR